MELSANVVPLRRRNYFNQKVTTLNLYHRTQILKDVEKALKEAGGDPLLNRFRDGPFGHFVGWRPGQSNVQVLHSILCRAIIEDGGMFFYVKGERIEFTAPDFALVTGLQFGESSWDPNKHLNANQSRLHKRLCRKDLKLGRELLSLINKDPKRFQNDQDTLLSLVNLLIANTFILGHDIKNAPFAWLWRLADDPVEFNRFPWGANSFLTLRYYVEHALDSDVYYFYGPAWALIVWGYEVIGGISAVAGVLENEHAYPRCLRWKFSKSLREETTVEKFFQIVYDPEYVMCNIAPDQWEAGLEYFRSSLVPNPLDVFFYVPVAVTGEPSQFPPEARTRRPMHDQDDILDGTGGRPRRSTQSRRYMGEEEQTSARGSRSRRDPGKRPREDTSSGSRGHDIPSYATPEDVRRIVKEEIEEQNAEIDRKLEGFMNKVKSMFEEVKALFSCKSTSIPRSVSQPQRGRGGRPPIVTSGRASSARPSGAATTGAGGSRSSGIQHVTAEVGDRRDTTLPLYTDSGPSEPSTTLGMYQDASYSDAWTAFTGQSSTYIPPFSAQYTPPATYQDYQPATYQDYQPGRFSLPENISSADYSTATAPNVTIRARARSSTSQVERGQSSGSSEVSLKAVGVYTPMYEPAWPSSRVQEDFKIWISTCHYSYKLRYVPDQIAAVTAGELKEMIRYEIEWNPLMLDLALMTLRKQLQEGDRVLPPYAGGVVMICNTQVMVDLKGSFQRLKEDPSFQRLGGDNAVRHHWILQNWVPTTYLSNLMHNRAPTYETTNWWRTQVVLLPWEVQDRYVGVLLNLPHKQIFVLDPLYWSLDRAGKTQVKQDLGALMVLLPYWLIVGGYYENNVYNLKAPVPDEARFTLFFRKPNLLIGSEHHKCSAVVTCLNIEHVFSGSPAVEAATNQCCKYRSLYACRIFRYATV